ncbi:uncharacterized protein K444DRAFT_178697 [Hyaloscypha bicolor E]|uniref:Uncharacterized protein n=1 Tax=Hyaloscypha bicolor E TaxID=1095630 RepID=A0A2J6TQU4_9HELO|nr:uncharacterized protein K444DRAFT_178697 [Hyaloscypha bicolor E]PMD65379.1 hypothetical protein K444DRAFT_178697 [Hyaloscypha bicolor E]
MHAGGLRFFFEMLIFESAEATNAVIERHQCFPCRRPSDHKANFARVSPQNRVHRQPAQSLLPALLTASLPLFPPPYNCNHTTTQPHNGPRPARIREFREPTAHESFTVTLARRFAKSRSLLRPAFNYNLSTGNVSRRGWLTASQIMTSLSLGGGHACFTNHFKRKFNTV